MQLQLNICTIHQCYPPPLFLNYNLARIMSVQWQDFPAEVESYKKIFIEKVQML